MGVDRRELLCAAAGAAALFAGGGVLRAWAGPSGSGSSAQLLRPPGGQDENRLLGACVRCGRCRSVCPAQCIAVAHVEDGLVNARTPKLDFTRGACDFCGKCVEVCPTAALGAFDPACDKIGCAVVDEAACMQCGKCVPACPYAALNWDGERGLPVVDAAACNGCGVCENVCPSASYGYYDGAARRAVAVAPINALMKGGAQ